MSASISSGSGRLVGLAIGRLWWLFTPPGGRWLAKVQLAMAIRAFGAFACFEVVVILYFEFADRMNSRGPYNLDWEETAFLGAIAPAILIYWSGWFGRGMGRLQGFYLMFLGLIYVEGILSLAFGHIDNGGAYFREPLSLQSSIVGIALMALSLYLTRRADLAWRRWKLSR